MLVAHPTHSSTRLPVLWTCAVNDRAQSRVTVCGECVSECVGESDSVRVPLVARV